MYRACSSLSALTSTHITLFPQPQNAPISCICSLFSNCVGDSKNTAPKLRVTVKGRRRERSWPNIHYYFKIYLKGLRKTSISLSESWQTFEPHTFRTRNVQNLQQSFGYFHIFHIFVNSSVPHATVATLNTHAFVYSNIFHTLWSQKSMKEHCRTQSLFPRLPDHCCCYETSLTGIGVLSNEAAMLREKIMQHSVHLWCIRLALNAPVFKK